MRVEEAFEYQMEEKRPRLTFIGYNHPKVDNAVKLFYVVPSKLELLDQVWELMTPLFINDSALMPRLRWIGPR